MNYIRVDITKAISEKENNSHFSIIFKPILEDLDKFYFMAQEFSFSVKPEEISGYFKAGGIDDEIEKKCFYYNEENSCGSYYPNFLKDYCVLLSDLDPTLIFFNQKEDNSIIENVFNLRHRGVIPFVKSFKDIECFINNEDGRFWELIDKDGKYVNMIIEHLNTIDGYSYETLPIEESFFTTNSFKNKK